jgi:hypothetical protein
MSDKKKDPNERFLSNLHSFFESDFGEPIEVQMQELKAAGIDPEREVSWVNQFVASKVRDISQKNLERARTKRSTTLARLAELGEANRDRLEEMIDELRSKLAGQRSDLAEFQSAYNKLENPTEEDLRSILKDWVELAEWEESLGMDDNDE